MEELSLRRMTARAVRLFPQPDSPTRATVSPEKTEKETSSTTGITSPSELIERLSDFTSRSTSSQPPIVLTTKCTKSTKGRSNNRQLLAFIVLLAS
jgi:hypothetical protein